MSDCGVSKPYHAFVANNNSGKLFSFFMISILSSNSVSKMYLGS